MNKRKLVNIPEHEISFSISDRLRERDKNKTEKISDYLDLSNFDEHEKIIVINTICFLFPKNRFVRGIDNLYSNVSRAELIQELKIGEYEYFSKYLEHRIGEGNISESNFKKIVAHLDKSIFEEIAIELEQFKKYDRDQIIDKLFSVIPSLSPLGQRNIAQLLCTDPFYFVNSNFYGRFIDRQTRIAIDIISNLPEESKFETVEFIAKYCPIPQYVSEFLDKCETGKEVGPYESCGPVEPIEKIYPIIKAFYADLIEINAGSIFNDVDNFNSYLLFKRIESNGLAKELKKVLEKFIKEAPGNVMQYFKSLLEYTYYGLSGKGEIPYEIKRSYFRDFEEFVEQETLIEKTYNLFPEFRDELPGLMGKELMMISPDKRIAIQYLRYVSEI